MPGNDHDVRVRVFGVTHGSLMERMLRRRGFEWSRYRWHRLRVGRVGLGPWVDVAVPVKAVPSGLDTAQRSQRE
jgi:hypothetical protein